MYIQPLKIFCNFFKKVLTFLNLCFIINFVVVNNNDKLSECFAQIAQSVEQRTENPRVGGSIPSLGICLCGCGSMVEHQPSKLRTWVRFPSPALWFYVHEWLSGRASPCQGEGRGFESRLVLYTHNK